MLRDLWSDVSNMPAAMWAMPKEDWFATGALLALWVVILAGWFVLQQLWEMWP